MAAAVGASTHRRVFTSRRSVILGGAGALSGPLLVTAVQCRPAGQPGGARGTPSAGLSGRVQWQIRGGPTYKQLADWATEEFRKKFPNITIEASPDTTGDFSRTTATLVAGSGPDIIHGWGQLMVQYASKGVLANMNDFTKSLAKADTDDFVDQQ
jgi:ABC-type glycerol-3-phosphate transport system substrate-binding protein